MKRKSEFDHLSVRELCCEYGLEEYQDQIERDTLPCWRGDVVKTPIELACSKFGGNPHVPANFEWPRHRDRPLPFMAQINLSELGPCELPASGLLSFFFNVWHCSVQFFDPGDDLAVSHAPEAHRRVLWLFNLNLTPQVYPELRLQMRESFALPTLCDIKFSEWEDVQELQRGKGVTPFADFEDEAVVDDRYIPMWEEMQSVTQVLGRPCPVHLDDMEEGCVARGGRGKPWDWKLLLQVGESPENRVYWGDCGKWYVWIHRDDLAASRFDHTIAMFQNS